MSSDNIPFQGLKGHYDAVRAVKAAGGGQAYRKILAQRKPYVARQIQQAEEFMRNRSNGNNPQYNLG